MSTGFTYDVIVRNISGGAAQYFAGELRKRSLNALDFSWTPGPRNKEAPYLEAALQNSRVMILLLSSYMPDEYWWILEGESFLFRDPQHPEKKLIVIRLDGAPLKPGLEKCLSFEWRWTYPDLEKAFEPIYLACLPQNSFEETPTATAEDCPLKRLFSLGHAGEVTALAISPDSQKAISASHDHTLRLWHLPTFRCERIFQKGEKKYHTVALHPNKQLAVSGDSEGMLICWDLDTGEPVYTLEGHSGAVNSVCWNPDGSRLVSGSVDGTLRIWQDKACLRILTGHAKSVSSVSWSVQGHLLSSSADQTIRIWDAEKGNQLHELNMQDVQQVSYSPNGNLYLARTTHGGLQIWNAASNKLFPPIKDKTGKTMRVTAAAWGPDSNSILLCPDSGNDLLVKDLTTGKLEEKFSYAWGFRARCLAWSPDGRFCLLGRTDGAIQFWDMGKEHLSRFPNEPGHHGALCRTALSHDGRLLASGGADETARLWNFETGTCMSTLDKGHKGDVCGLAWSPDNRFVVSASQKNKDLRLSGLKLQDSPFLLYGQGQPAQLHWGPDTRLNISGTSPVNPRDYILGTSNDHTVRLWKRSQQEPVQTFRGHRSATTTVRWSPDGRQALSGSFDTTVKLWEIFTGKEVAEWRGHNGAIMDLSWSPDGTQAASASLDRTLRIWNVATGQCLQILEGHTAVVLTVAWSPDGQFLASGAEDKTVRIWDAYSGECLYELRDHTEKIVTVAWTNDGRDILASAANGVMHIWDVSILQTRPRSSVNRGGYTIAKVMICGNSGVGKTALAHRLAHDKFEYTSSTDGVWATQCSLPHQPSDNERQVWLWDFPGQSDYRLVHQLFMHDADVVVLLFDPQDKKPFENLDGWVQDLQKLRNTSRRPFKMLLAAGRVDCGNLWVSPDDITPWMKKHGFEDLLYLTSSKTGEGCATLLDAIVETIDWPGLPVISSPALYTRLTQEILTLRDTGQPFISLASLNSRLEHTLKGTSFTLKELETVITSLTRTGIIRRVDFDDLILLKPEILSRYAGALIRKVHNQPNQMGYIDEQDLFDGNLDYQSLERLPAEQERSILVTLYGLLVRQPWVMRQTNKDRTLLIFPTYFRRERPAQKNEPGIAWSYHFHGAADEIYATLVVHLSNTETFIIEDLWRNAVDLKTPEGQPLGLRLVEGSSGDHRLDLWFQTDKPMPQLFLQYIYNHLCTWARDVSQPPGDEKQGWPEIERLLLRMEENSDAALNNLDKEAQLFGIVEYLTSTAGQIFRPTSKYDVGIDGHIEFKEADGTPSAKTIYLQLKSGNSYLRHRESDDKNIFQIQKRRHVNYWKKHRDPVMLVVRTSQHGTRWMDVREYIINAEADGARITYIVFDGEPFTPESIRRWRDKVLTSAE